MNEQEFKTGVPMGDNAAAKRAAEGICASRRLQMPAQDFVNRGAGTLGADTPVAASELEHQISELEVSANRLEQILEIAAKKLDPVIAKYPSNEKGGGVNPLPSRHSYVGHRLQQIQVRLDNLTAAVAELNDRLAV